LCDHTNIQHNNVGYITFYLVFFNNYKYPDDGRLLTETCSYLNEYSLCMSITAVVIVQFSDDTTTTTNTIIIFFSGSAAQRGLWPPSSRGFLITHNDAPQSVGLLWTSDQLVAETYT
jgi:hypothetical protein